MFDYRKYNREMGRQKLIKKDIQDKTGINQNSISMILSGKQEPRPHTIQMLAEALSMDYEDFYIDAREKHDVQWHYQRVLDSVANLSRYTGKDDKMLEKLIAKHDSLVEGYHKLYGHCLPAEDIVDDDAF